MDQQTTIHVPTKVGTIGNGPHLKPSFFLQGGLVKKTYLTVYEPPLANGSGTNLYKIIILSILQMINQPNNSLQAIAVQTGRNFSPG